MMKVMKEFYVALEEDLADIVEDLTKIYSENYKSIQTDSSLSKD